MYGTYHPLYARHLILEQAMFREALRERSAIAPEYPPVRRTRPVRPRTPLTRWAAPLATAVVGLAVVASLMAVDPSGASRSARQLQSPTQTTCPLPGNKVNSFAPCVPSAV